MCEVSSRLCEIHHVNCITLQLLVTTCYIALREVHISRIAYEEPSGRCEYHRIAVIVVALHASQVMTL